MISSPNALYKSLATPFMGNLIDPASYRIAPLEHGFEVVMKAGQRLIFKRDQKGLPAAAFEISTAPFPDELDWDPRSSPFEEHIHQGDVRILQPMVALELRLFDPMLNLRMVVLRPEP